MNETLAAAASEVQTAWADAFARRDVDALVALYTPQAAFYGSTATLHTDRAGIRRYFETLPDGFSRARYATPHILPLGPDRLVASGGVVFTVETAGESRDLAYRMTHVMVRDDKGWRIAAHHASPSP